MTASTAEAPPSLPENAPASVAPRRRTLQVGTGFAAGGVLMYFGALIGIYLSERSDFRAANPGESWIPSGVEMPLTSPTVIAWTLLLSVVTMQWAVRSSVVGDRRHTLIALLITSLFGAAVINAMVFYYRQVGLEIDGGSVVAPLIYVVTGSHLVFLVVALVFLFVMAVRVLASPQPSVHVDGMSAAALFWYAMVFVHWVIWLAVYVPK